MQSPSPMKPQTNHEHGLRHAESQYILAGLSLPKIILTVRDVRGLRVKRSSLTLRSL